MKTSIRLLVTALCLSTTVASGPAEAETKSESRTIGVVVPVLASSFWISAVYGMDKEARAQGAKLITLDAGGDANTSRQISQIQDLVQRKVDAIVVGATNGDGVKAIVEQAVEKGIPVIGISSPPNTAKLAAVVGADHYDMGRLQAQCLSKALGGKGRVTMLAGPAGQTWSELRAKGFKETLAKEAPGVAVVAENWTADSRNAALTTTEDWIQRFPDLTAVYAATDDMAAGAVSALSSADRLSAVKVSASNLSPTAQQLLNDGQLVCTSIQQTVAQGSAAVRQAIAAAAGKSVEKQVVLPAQLVTKDNLASVDLSAAVAPRDYRP